MATLLYRCPIAKMNVRGWVADDPTERSGQGYQGIVCEACTRVHFINPKTAKLLGQSVDDDR